MTVVYWDSWGGAEMGEVVRDKVQEKFPDQIAVNLIPDFGLDGKFDITIKLNN